MILAGVDLAWQSERNPSAIALGNLTDDTVSVSTLELNVHGISEVFERLNCCTGLVGVAIDAPLIINNREGQRPCEKDVGKAYGARGASCHTSNTELYPNAGSVHLSARLQASGFGHLEGARWQVECYPHPALIEIFGLSKRLKYKKGRLAEKRAGQAALASCIKKLQVSDILCLEIPHHYDYIFDSSHIDSLGGRALKANEDALDSIVCLYIAGLYAMRCDGRLFGDKASGYIWVPMVKCA